LLDGHRSVISRFLDIYTSTDGFTIVGGEILSGFGIVEGVYSSGLNAIIVDKLASVAQPNTDHILFELFALIIISFGGRIRKRWNFSSHRICLATYTQFASAVVRFRVLVLQFYFAVVRYVLDTVSSNQKPFYWCEQRDES
jgi:hypothetical protein